MTFPRSYSGLLQWRRQRRNRKRSLPLWQRLPSLAASAGQSLPRLCRSMAARARRCVPALVALVGSAAVFSGLWLGHHFLTTSPHFAIRVIEVRGNRALTPAELKAQMGVWEGNNIFQAKLGALAEAVQRDPWVVEAIVRRKLPDTLVVDLVERQAAAVIELGGLYLADPNGTVFKRFSPVRDSLSEDSLPVITGMDREDYIRHPDAAARKVRQALAALKVYEADSERPRIGEIHIDPRRGLTFVTYEHAVSVRVGHGEGDTLAVRLRAFDLAWKALSQAERRRARVVYADSSNRPDRVTVAFAQVE